MWQLYWKEGYGEDRNCSINEEHVRDTIIHICAAGVSLDEITVIAPEGRVTAHSMLNPDKF